MVRRFSVAAALACCCVAGLGCQSVTNCGDGCGRGRSMAFQQYDCSCDGACGACCGGSNACGCDTACGDSCGGGSSDGCSKCDPPVRRLMNWAFGCSGCGECYWNEWHNDPPPLCEPCNRCGQYVGPGSVGNYQAPYRRHEGSMAAPPSDLPPLEQTEPPTNAEPPTDVEATVDEEFLP